MQMFEVLRDIDDCPVSKHTPPPIHEQSHCVALYMYMINLVHVYALKQGKVSKAKSEGRQ